jgi:hypothetical protein
MDDAFEAYELFEKVLLLLYSAFWGMAYSEKKSKARLNSTNFFIKHFLSNKISKNHTAMCSFLLIKYTAK